MEEKLRLLKRIAPDLTEEMIRRYRVLKTVKLLQPCGRRMVVLSLGMTERTVRSEIERFSMHKLVEVSKTGMTLTEDGNAVLEGLEPIFAVLTGLTGLEEQVTKHLGVNCVYIAQGDVDESSRTRKEMGQLAMRYLLEKVNYNSMIAITGGSTMDTVVEAVPEMGAPIAKMVVPARGSIGRKMELQADTLAVRLAEKLQGDYRLLHVPDNLSETALEEMKKQPDIAETLEEMEKANILLLGVGNGLETAKKRNLDEDVQIYLEQKGAVAEAGGYYFGMAGEVLYKTPSLAVDIKKMSATDEVIVVAGGSRKAESIFAVSRSIPRGTFIIDEGAAMEILSMPEKTK